MAMPRANRISPAINQRSQRGLEVSAGGGTAGWSGIDGIGAAGLSILGLIGDDYRSLIVVLSSFRFHPLNYIYLLSTLYLTIFITLDIIIS